MINNIAPGAKKLRDAYAVKKDAPVYMREFGFYSADRWIKEGHIKSAEDLHAICGFDEPGMHGLGNIGGCEAPFEPSFDIEILEDRGEHEVVRDAAGRSVLYFKGRRQGFMPEYINHPVKDFKSWETLCKWRLTPQNPARVIKINETIANTAAPAANGLMLCQYIVGGYMYLRSLMGPEGLLFMFYDDPALVRDCMETWFDVADFVTAEYQKHYTLDEILFDEDICYNHGSLISPEMIDEFLMPYYKQLIENIRKRQIDRDRRLFVYLATDGDCMPVIPIYQKIGVNHVAPFEAASNCDVVKAGAMYPDMVIGGGMDKREIAKGKTAIDKMVGRIMPVMKKRGGYIPTCDHGVPEEVAFDDYIHFRKRLSEYA